MAEVAVGVSLYHEDAKYIKLTPVTLIISVPKRTFFRLFMQAEGSTIVTY